MLWGLSSSLNPEGSEVQEGDFGAHLKSEWVPLCPECLFVALGGTGSDPGKTEPLSHREEKKSNTS